MFLNIILVCTVHSWIYSLGLLYPIFIQHIPFLMVTNGHKKLLVILQLRYSFILKTLSCLDVWSSGSADVTLIRILEGLMHTNLEFFSLKPLRYKDTKPCL